jgi:hypothetical protein
VVSRRSKIAYFEFQPPDNGFLLLMLQDTRGGDKSRVSGDRRPVYGAELDWACTRAGEAPSAVPTPHETSPRCNGTFEVVHRSIRPGNLLRVDFTPAGEGWAVGEDGVRVVRFDDDTHKVVAGVPPAGGGVYLSDVSALSSDHVFVAGSQESRGGRRWCSAGTGPSGPG